MDRWHSEEAFLFWIFITALLSISQRVNGMSEQCAVSEEYDLYDGYNFEDIDNIVKDSTQGSFDFTYIIKQLFREIRVCFIMAMSL